jgi:hypothetical protein
VFSLSVTCDLPVNYYSLELFRKGYLLNLLSLRYLLSAASEKTMTHGCLNVINRMNSCDESKG